MNRKQILNEMEQIMSSYCHGCFLYKHHRQELGRTAAHKFCISQCTVGEKIKSYGKQL